ncbi:MAG TPA: apolipoprotein N-acyltransferase [Pseudonocardia sp.]|nr:apolipoprotein N-acyltransferase [Pseudonocardia sp.]
MIRRPTVVRRPVTGTGLLRAARVLAAPVGGLLLYLACAPRTLWWLAPLAFALLAAALHERSRRDAFAVGLMFGLGFYLPLLPWVGIYVGKTPWLALAGFEALLVGLGAVLIAGVHRLPLSPVWAAACWTATEAVAARVPFGGFPWGKVAFSQADGPFTRLAAVGGPALVGFAVVLTGFGLSSWVRSGAAAWPTHGWRGLWRGGRPAGRAAAACAVLPVFAAVLCPAWLTGATPRGTEEDGTEITVAAVQGNVPRLGLEFNAQRRAVLDNHVRRTLQLADDVAAGRVPAPRFVVWPENASDIDPLRNPDAAAEISGAADRIGAPILVGAVLVLPDNRHTANSVIVWEPGQGPTERNDKRRVLPFGEYLPWRPFFRLLSDYADKAGYFVPGDGPGVVQAAGVQVGVEICWEIAFDDLVGDSVRNGAEILAVPTNNATFGISEMTFQQLAMSRLRAVQYDRAVVVAATSGVSAVIDPDGAELQHTGQFTPAALVERIPLRRTTTLASRLGSLPEWLLVIVGVGAFVAAARRHTPSNPVNPMPVHSREDEDG